MKDWKKIYQANSPWKQVGVAILISDEVDFKLTLIKWDKGGHFILIKGAIHQKEIIIINLYAPTVRTPNFIKHIPNDLKAHINSNTVLVGFSTPLSPIDRPSKQKINKEILELNDIINHTDITVVYRIFYPTTAQHTFFWSYLRTQSKPQQI
jgi:hypothetical protein